LAQKGLEEMQRSAVDEAFFGSVDLLFFISLVMVQAKKVISFV
jgi:hypothetical protein